MSKKLLQEKNSVSEQVVKVTNKIYDEIRNDFDNTELFLSKPYGIEVKENTIKVPLTDIDEKLGDLTVIYIVYLFESEEEMQYIFKHTKLETNSQYDHTERTLTIVTSYYDNNFSPDTEGIIYHEVTHFYQYTMGMEKRVSLYKKMHDYIKVGKKDIDAYFVALVLYYTFPHEQDAFAHEYFSLILDTKGQITIDEYNEYHQAKHAYDIVKQHHKGNKMMLNAIKNLGYDVKSYFIRLHYGMKRFRKKLENVEIYYETELKEQRMTSEQIVKMNIKIGCKYLMEGKEFFFPERKYEHFFKF